MNVCKLIGAVFHEAICDDMNIVYDLDYVKKLASVIR